MARQLRLTAHSFALMVFIGISSIGLSACTVTRVLPPHTANANVASHLQNTETEKMGLLRNEGEIDRIISASNNPEIANEEGCTDALYWADEPISSQMILVSAADLEAACNNEQIACMNRCMNNPKPPYPAQKKGDRAHYAHCHRRCLKQFMTCMRKAGLLQEFSVLDAAWSWIKSHGKEIVGTVVVIGGVAYIVSTGGSGALVLVVL